MKKIVLAASGYCAIHFNLVSESPCIRARENTGDCSKSTYFWFHVETSPSGPYCLQCVVSALNWESRSVGTARLAQFKEFLKDYPEIGLE